MQKSDVSTIEVLPNELFLDVCKYLTFREIYLAFYGLNNRFRSIIDNTTDLCLTITKVNSPEPVWLFFSRVVKLTLDDVNMIDLARFPKLRSLTWIFPSNAQLQQLCSFIYASNLEQLRVYTTNNTELTALLHQSIFSNRFEHLSVCQLLCVNIGLTWTMTSSLRILVLRDVADSHTLERVLMSCPNLIYLALHSSRAIVFHTLSLFQHKKLKKLFLRSYGPSESVCNILAMVPGLVRFYLTGTVRQTLLDYFHNLANTFNMFLPNIDQFTCNLYYTGRCPDITSVMSHLERLHPCFENSLDLERLSHGRLKIRSKHIYQWPTFNM